jgi:phosphoribosylaminoimidazole carboxylase
MFVLPDGALLINEVAPRPHNSGHYTMNACQTSQFEQVLRAVLGWPLGSTAMLCPAAAMLNILGEAGPEGERVAGGILARGHQTTGANVHWYGKEFREGRKLGHVNFTSTSWEQLWQRLEFVAGSQAPGDALRSRPAALEGGEGAGLPPVAIIMGSDSDLPTMAPAAEMLRELGVECAVSVVSAHRTPHRMFEFASSAHRRGVKVCRRPFCAGRHCTQTPVV